MRQFEEAFAQADAQIVLVAMGKVEQTASFKQQLRLPFPMASDPERKLYQTYKIGFMTIASALSPTVALKMISAVAKGHGIGFPYGDIRQLPAAFIINTDGTILYSHYGKNPADHPAPEDILNAL